MESRRAETIEGFNSYVVGLRSDGLDIRLSLTQFTLPGFSGVTDRMTFERTFEMRRLNEVPELTRETYQPGGSTPLYDAIARLIEDTERDLSSYEFDSPKVLVVIMTDGEENASTRYRLDQVRDMIKHQEASHDWTFMYLGVEPAAWEQGQKIFSGTMSGENVIRASGGGGRLASFATASASTAGYASSDSMGPETIVTDAQKSEVESASD